MNKPERVKCQCPCHKHRIIKHIVPCCDNGWIELPAVPAPTVATDDSGEEETYDCIHCNGTGQHSKPGLVQLVSPLASPVEEEQEELWMQVAVDCHGITIKGVSKVIKELSDKFIITRKR